MKTFNPPQLVGILALGVFALSAGCASGPKKKEPSERERVALYVDAAQAAIVEKDPVGAMQFLKSAEEIDPNYAPIYHARAMAYTMRKQDAEALLDMKHAVELDPKNSYSNNTYGKMLLDAGRVNEAEQHLKVAATDPTFRESYKARTSLGILYYRQNRMDEADRSFEQASNEDPANSCIAYYYRGHIAVKRNQLSQAAQYYDRASSKLCAGFADAHFALGLVHEKSRRFDLARKKFLDVSQNFPEAPVSEQAVNHLKKIP